MTTEGETIRTRTCGRCKQAKPFSDFGKTKSSRSPTGFYWRSRCRACDRDECRIYAAGNKEKRNDRLKNWRKSNPEKARANDARKRPRYLYGISVERRDEMHKEQNGACAICLEVRRLVIDHCHATGRVRGLLCYRCNSLLAQVEKIPDFAERAISYCLYGPNNYLRLGDKFTCEEVP